MQENWRPTADIAVLQLRAQVYQRIREFFAKREVLEVETPILSMGTVPEPMIEPFYTEYHSSETKRLFLQTSPELAMKRLLAAGSGSIYQIAKVFRNGETGSRHNPEFTLLEWYRVGFSQNELIQEIGELLQKLLGCLPIETVDYCDLFTKTVGLHPLDTSLTDLQQYATQQGIHQSTELARDACLQFILAHCIETDLGYIRPIAVTHFPISQAALARRHPIFPEVAERFEVYFEGMELANGFHELADFQEQRYRFEQDLIKRQQLGMQTVPLDEHFLTALACGLPDCCGVALGLDRLLMSLTGARHIREVLPFTIDNC